MNTSHLKKADGIEALVMGYPIPPLFCGIDFVAVVGSLSFTGFALLRQIRRYQNKNPGTFATFLRLATLFRPHTKQESDASWQITCAFAP